MDRLFELQSLTRTHVGPLIAPEGLPYWRPGGGRGSDPEVVAPILDIPGLHGLLAWKAVVARNRLARLELLRVQADSIVDRLERGSTTD